MHERLVRGDTHPLHPWPSSEDAAFTSRYHASTNLAGCTRLLPDCGERGCNSEGECRAGSADVESSILSSSTSGMAAYPNSMGVHTHNVRDTGSIPVPPTIPGGSLM